jgi:hypothetical protein
VSAYDDAVAYLDAEVHPRCDYEIYSDMRDIVDEMEDESKKLRELVRDMYGYAANREMELCNECACADDGDCGACDEYDGACGIAKRRFEELYSDRIREFGIEVSDD